MEAVAGSTFFGWTRELSAGKWKNRVVSLATFDDLAIETLAFVSPLSRGVLVFLTDFSSSLFLLPTVSTILYCSLIQTDFQGDFYR